MRTCRVISYRQLINGIPGRSESKTAFSEMLRKLLRFFYRQHSGEEKRFCFVTALSTDHSGHMPLQVMEKSHTGSPLRISYLGPLSWDPSWTVRFPFLGGRPLPSPGHGRCDPFLKQRRDCMRRKFESASDLNTRAPQCAQSRLSCSTELYLGCKGDLKPCSDSLLAEEARGLTIKLSGSLHGWVI